MKISVFLQPWGETALPANFDTFISAVDSLPYHTLWIGDHIVFPLAVASSYPYNNEGRSPFDPRLPYFEPLTLTSYMAARTERVRLGISVLVLAMRHPVEAAKALAGVDALSRGRLTVGVGAGWMAEEFAILNADYASRGPRTDEGIAILRHLWAGSEDAFSGSHYDIAPVLLTPLPANTIPIVVGGNTKAAINRAVTLGDGWHALRTEPVQLARQIDGLRRRLDDLGRDSRGFSVVTRDSLIGSAAASQPPSVMDGRALRGAVLDRYYEYQKAGVDEFIVEFPNMPIQRQVEWIDWLAAVIPASSGAESS